MKAGAAPAGAAPAAAAAATPIYATLWDLPDPLLEAVFGLLGLNDLAACACASAAFQQAAHRALAAKRAVTAADLPFLARAHNYLLLGGPSCGGSGREGSGGAADHSDHPDGRGSPGPGLSAALSAGTAAADRLRARVLGQHCPALQRLHLELPPPQIPLSAAAEAVARAAAGEAWGVGGALALGFGGVLAPPASECPPVDGFLLKLLAQCCPGLRSLRLVNVTNNPTMSRLIRPNDAALGVLARSCPELEELVLGHRGGQEVMFTPHAPFYLDDVNDAGLRAVAQHCRRLGRLCLLRCSRVGDDSLMAVAQLCHQLTALVLHDCPGISDRALVEVGERCPQLRVLDCTVARRAGGLLLMGEEPEQLGFRALFTIAANCPLLEEVCVSEEGLEAPVVDDDCVIVLAQGCPRLRRLALRHCGAVTDAGLRAVATRCKQLTHLTLEHTGVGDEGVLAAARGLPLLQGLTIANYTSNLSALLGGPRLARGVGDAALAHVADHCSALQHLSLTGSRRVTDAGLQRLAGLYCRPPAPGLLAQLTSLTINHTAATDGAACELLRRCGQLRSLALRGLLYSADAMAACVGAHCRQLTSLDLRHCSTLSDAGLGEVARLPYLRCLHLSFCVRLTDAALLHLAGGARGGAAGPTGSASGAAADRAVAATGEGQAAGLAAAPAAQNGAAAQSGGPQGTPLLEQLELYHCPQVTHRGLWSLVQACPHLLHLNIGKCRQVRADSLRPLLAARPALRLTACHYLDS